MAVEAAQLQWRVIGASTRGAAHTRLGLPNQDAFLCWAARGEVGPRALLAVSDGHGAAYHFRSGIGSRIAVETASSLLRESLAVASGSRTLDGNAEALRSLLHEIVASWRQAVATHLAKNPFTNEELDRLAKAEKGPDALARVKENPEVAYGATLLAVLVCDGAILYLQLGDGDILRVGADGRTERPLPADPHSTGVETASLCLPDAEQGFRTHLEKSGGAGPALILLSSDGYSNSFRSDKDFLQIGPDYLDILRQRGPDSLAAELGEILAEASSQGSGDDVTLGLLAREGELKTGVTDLGLKTRSSLEREVAKLKAERSVMKEKIGVEAARAEQTVAAANKRANLSVILGTVALAAVAGGVFWAQRHASNSTIGKKDANPAAVAKPAADAGKRDKGDADAKAKGEPQVFTLRVEGEKAPQPIALEDGTTLEPGDFGLDEKKFGSDMVAEVLEMNGVLYLKNDSKKVWKYKMPGSDAEQPLKPAHELKLERGLAINFGAASATVR
jgi:serine/threonine protein phosphatase PrpC